MRRMRASARSPLWARAHEQLRRGRPDVRGLYEAGINIQMINTSEIRVSVLLDEEDVNRAVRAIHDKFFGEI